MGALYVGADRRVRRERGRGVLASRRRCFLAGLVVVFAALQSPIDADAATSLSVHMVQHLLLTMVAAPLLVLGAPVTLGLLAWKGTPRRWLLSVLHSLPVRLLANPLVGWSLFFVVMWGSHLTGVYEAALRSGWIHAIEHLAYLGTALLFWMPVVGVDPVPSRLSHPARILYLFLAMPAMTFLGVAIYSARDVLYVDYLRVEGVSRALADQQLAGAIMWEGAIFPIVLALAYVLIDWMRVDEREARRTDERLLGRRVRTGIIERQIP